MYPLCSAPLGYYLRTEYWSAEGLEVGHLRAGELFAAHALGGGERERFFIFYNRKQATIESQDGWERTKTTA